MMLKLLLTACLLVTALSENADVSSTVCNSCIDNLCYTESTNIKNSLDRVVPMFLAGIPAFDITEDILYYSTAMTTRYTKINKDMRKSYPVDVPGVSYYVKDFTVDQKTRQVYIWKKYYDEYNHYPNITNNVYRYDPVTHTTDQIKVTSVAINEMHFKEKLYYTLMFRNGIFEYHNGMSTSIPAFEGYNVTQFIVDKLEDVYATTEAGVYRLKKDAGQATLFTDKKYSVSVDKDEKMYFLDPVLKKVLRLDYTSDRIVDAGVINSVVSDRIIFDKHNNILFKRRAMGGAAIWAFILPIGECGMNGTFTNFVPNSSSSLLHFDKTFIFLILAVFSVTRPFAI